MKKIILFLSVTAFAGLFALSVDVNELKKGKKIEFINYSGPGRNDSSAAVRGIGYSLAEKSSSGQDAGFMGKYSIRRIVSDKEPEKFSAEIFSIHKDAQVDHVNNIRKILAAYFEKRYSYTKDESYALAVFCTYYNALYRGNTEYFKTVYKSDVMKNINTANAGLDIKYSEWPGKTKILIPLTETGKGDAGVINPDEISGENVRKEVKKDDKNLEPRKTINEMKEKKLEKDKEDVKKKKDEIIKEKKDNESKEKEIAENKKKIDEKKKEIAEKDKKIDEKKKEAEKITDPEKKKDELKKIDKENTENTEQKDKLKEQEKKVKEDEEKLKQDQEKTKNKETETNKKEESNVKKEEDLNKEKKDIEKDELKNDIKKGDPAAVDKLEKKEEELAKKEEELKKKEEDLKKGQVDKNVIGDKIYYLKIREFLRNGNYNNDLCMIDAANRKILFNSNVPNISGSKYDLFAEGIVVITRVDNEYTQHRLTLVDKDKLTALKTGKDNIFYRSFIEIREASIYAIVKEGEDYYLGRFDKDLNLTAKSQKKVSQDTFLTFYGDYIYINSEDKKILILNKTDLKFIDIIDPSKTVK